MTDYKLTKRELDVISLLGKGLNNQQIGVRLGVKRITVKYHLSNIYRKLDVNTRTQVAVYAFKRGLIT